MPAKRDALRQRLFNEQNGKCHLCGGDMVLASWGSGRVPFPNAATFDHLIPRCIAGRGGIKNLKLACSLCNGKRGHRSLDAITS